MVTWTNRWISNNESLYSIISKYRIANVLEPDYIKRTFYIPSNLNYKENNELQLIIPQSFNITLLSEQLNFDLNKYFLKQLSLWRTSNISPLIINDLISKHFRYCTTCIANGYHSNLQQLYYFEYCPFHNLNKLLEKCTKCNRKSDLSSKIYETDINQCKCNFIFERFSFLGMKNTWITTSVETTYDEILFPTRKYIIIDKPVKNTDRYFSNINLTNLRFQYIVKNTIKSSVHVDSELLTPIYKSFLRKIRGQCKKKCHKTYFRKGDRALLCFHCTSYLKLRRQYENITNEWDIFFNYAPMISGLKRFNCWMSNFVNSFNEWISPISLSQTALLNLQSYMLYHSLINEYQKWLVFSKEKNYPTVFNLTFTLETTNKGSIILKIY
ncbi:hypothetical protein [Planococcus soli]|uniref:hypothetical protein n=1 Tax=Planococcus soli TaxID=2666072 RepID=UPI00115F597E|nr:hypothetical protein [Planococcus soli]